MSLMLYAAMGAATVPSAPSPIDDAFVFTVRTGSDNPRVQWHTVAGEDYDLMVDWGDGSPLTHVNEHPSEYEWEHYYAQAGDYDIRVTGQCSWAGSLEGIVIESKVIDVKQWGAMLNCARWERAFFGEAQLTTISAPDAFGSGVTNTNSMFAMAPLTDSCDLSHWDMSAVVDAFGMFAGISSNPNVEGWDLSNATNLDSMFFMAANFDRDLSGWCVPLVASEPADFATSSGLFPAHYPVWGTCP